MDKISTDFLKMGEKFLNFLEKLRKCQKFKRGLEYILTFGNYINGIGFYGGAYGFKMDTLSKLSEVKTNDNTRNLLDYIIEVIYKTEKDRDLLNYNLELQDLQKGIFF